MIGRRRFLRNSGRWALAISGALRIRDAWPSEISKVDYAESRYVDCWLRHPVFGDPSFDSFQRVPGNPIHTGVPPFGWPVNGFLFLDPVSGNWFIFVGDYATGYVGPPPSRCLLYRSKNRGQTWENLGPVLQGSAEMFDKNGHTPDVSVVFADGRYHMVYDWGVLNFNHEGGLAYAWADKPEGPWRRDAQPITVNSTLTPLLGKYQRTYTATLVRRKHDWMILAMMDRAPYSWALFAMTAPDSRGPYAERKLVRHVEASYFHPPLLEFYPAFVDGGWVYAPATSVARNRDFQVLFRAPLERATDPLAWEMARHGSVWHSEDVPNEAYGIWGQTFSGWIDRERHLWAMFPSRNEEGLGTINLAVRPWSTPLRARGFHLSGHTAPSLTCLRRGYSDYILEAELRVRGGARIVWDYQAPLGPDRPTSDAVLHPLSLARHQGLDLRSNTWRIITIDMRGTLRVVAAGMNQRSEPWKVTLSRNNNGETVLALDGIPVWKGKTSAGEGAIGLLANSHSHVSVDRFAVTGKTRASTLSFLYTEGLLGAGENAGHWLEQTNSVFRFGVGAVRKEDGGRVKWNFAGTGFTLWSPQGPDYRTVEVRLDGTLLATVDLHATELQASQPVFQKTELADTFHAVTLEPARGRLVVDSLDVKT